jgi:hypothetical protein
MQIVATIVPKLKTGSMNGDVITSTEITGVAVRLVALMPKTRVQVSFTLSSSDLRSEHRHAKVHTAGIPWYQPVYGIPRHMLS